MPRVVIAVLAVGCSDPQREPAPRPVPIADARAVDAVVVADAPSGPVDAKVPVDTSRGAVIRVNGGEPGVFPFGVAVPAGKNIHVWLYRQPWPCDRPVSEGPQEYVSFVIPIGGRRSVTASIDVKGTFTMPTPEARAQGASTPEHTFFTLSNISDGTLTIERRGRKRGEHVRGRLAGNARNNLSGTTEATGNFDVELCRDVGSW